eukprot:1901217-Prymnesium_polylepis.1
MLVSERMTHRGLCVASPVCASHPHRCGASRAPPVCLPCCTLTVRHSGSARAASVRRVHDPRGARRPSALAAAALCL